MRPTAALAALLVAAGCVPAPLAGPSVPPVPDAPGAGEPDRCGARQYQWLVGRPRSEIPSRPASANWRIVCLTCPITMDYSPQRMNIFYDAGSDVVHQVRCG